MEKRRFRRNENGAVLLTVLCVMLMMIILVGASISFVNSTTQKTYRTFQAEQAYMTASTCLETFVTQIETDTNLETDQAKQKQAIDRLEALAADNEGKGYEYDVKINGQKDIEKMGSCTIRVSKFNDSIIVITATGKFGSEEEQVAAYVQTNTNPRRASFSNAIEICQDASDNFDNLNVLGDMATISGYKKTDSEGNKITYTLTNKLTVNGSFIVFGDVKCQSQPNIKLSPGLSSDSVGGRALIDGDWYSSVESYISTTIEKQDTNDDNFILVKGTVNVGNKMYVGNYIDGGLGSEDGTVPRTNKYAVDLFCHGFKQTSNEYYQLGDLVVFGGGTFDFQGTHGYLYGDMYVDGTINIKSDADFTVYGNVYCSGNIPSNLKVKGKRNVNGVISDNKAFPNTTVELSGRHKVPEMQDTYNEYERYPEDLIANPTSTIGVLKNKYDALHTTNPVTARSLYDAQRTAVTNGTASSVVTSKSKIDFYQDPSNTGWSLCKLTDKTDNTESNYVVYINKSCTWGDDFLDNDFKNRYNNGGKFLIHVTTEDIVILVKSDFAISDADQLIVVKNDSSASSPKCVYFVTDAGKVVGYADEAARKTNQKVTMNLNKSSIIDYDLYKAMFTAETIKPHNKGFLSCKVKDGFKLNLTSEKLTSVPDAYTPADEKIIYLVTNGSEFQKRLDGFHQGIIYGPESIYNVKVQNSVTIPKIYMSESDSKANIGLYCLGMVITGKFHSDNTNYYGFNAPDAASALSIVKKSKESQLSGYKLIRYEHH